MLYPDLKRCTYSTRFLALPDFLGFRVVASPHPPVAITSTDVATTRRMQSHWPSRTGAGATRRSRVATNSLGHEVTNEQRLGIVSTPVRELCRLNFSNELMES